jgi:hypothetical protein
MTDTKPQSWPEAEATQAGEPARRATDPAVRSHWTKEIARLREQSAVADPFLYSRELLEHLHRFEAAIAPSYRDILGSTLLWTEAERGFLQWAKDAFHAFARSAAGALRREAAHDLLLDEAGGELAAVALAAYGNAIKWSEISSAGYDPVSLVELRRVHELVERSGFGTRHFTVPREDHGASPTLDTLFIRAMLLDALCRGNLEPRQVEIVDSWLWEWAGEYGFTESDQGAVLSLEPGRQKGLRAPQGEARGRRFLRIEALENHIKLVTDGFRRGEIYPGYGTITEFRVEEHAAALDFLRRFLDAARYRRARESRTDREERLEACVGLAEILAKAFVPRAVTRASSSRAAAPAQPPGQQLAAIDSVYETPHREVRVLDESADGIGVEVQDDPMRPVNVGTVVTLHHADARPPILCEVMRRSLTQGGTVRLGLRILSNDPKKVELAQPLDGVAVEAVYVPSEDASGHIDALLVAESDFRPREDFEVRFDDRIFVLRMNRVRYHGRGWHLAGFEVSEERKPGDAVEAGLVAS